MSVLISLDEIWKRWEEKDMYEVCVCAFGEGWGMRK